MTLNWLSLFCQMLVAAMSCFSLFHYQALWWRFPSKWRMLSVDTSFLTFRATQASLEKNTQLVLVLPWACILFVFLVVCFVVGLGWGGRGRRLSFLLLKPVEGEEQIGLCLEQIFTDLKMDIRICIWRNLLPIAKRVCSSKPEFIEHDMQLTKSTLMVLCQNQGYGFCCDIAFFTEYATEWWEETLQLFVLTLWFAPLV